MYPLSKHVQKNQAKDGKNSGQIAPLEKDFLKTSNLFKQKISINLWKNVLFKIAHSFAPCTIVALPKSLLDFDFSLTLKKYKNVKIFKKYDSLI